LHEEHAISTDSLHCMFLVKVPKLQKATYLRHACPSFHMDELGLHWIIYEILYLSIFKKSVEISFIKIGQE